MTLTVSVEHRAGQTVSRLYSLWSSSEGESLIVESFIAELSVFIVQLHPQALILFTRACLTYYFHLERFHSKSTSQRSIQHRILRQSLSVIAKIQDGPSDIRRRESLFFWDQETCWLHQEARYHTVHQHVQPGKEQNLWYVEMGRRGKWNFIKSCSTFSLQLQDR